MTDRSTDRPTIQERAAELQALPETDLVALSDGIYGSDAPLVLRRDDHVAAVLDYEYGHQETVKVRPDWPARIAELQAEYEALRTA